MYRPSQKVSKAGPALKIKHVFVFNETARLCLLLEIIIFFSINKNQGIPWFHGASGPPVEVLFIVRHEGIVLPCLRHHGHHGFRQGPVAAHDQKFEDVVEASGIRHVALDHGVELREVVAQLRVEHHTLSCLHEVHVAPKGVDLPVVGKESVGVGTFPAGKRICRKPVQTKIRGFFS